MNSNSQSTDLNPSPDTSLFASNQPQSQVLGAKTATPSAQSGKSRIYSKAPVPYPPDQLENKKAVITTNKGTIEFQIFPDTLVASSNFIFLANDHFYDGLTFHRVEPGFVIQGGDPNGDGSGGPGYTLRETNIKGDFSKGVVAWAKTTNDPPGTLGSQFFIMIADNPLPPDYASFGKVISGQDVVDKIQIGDVMEKVTIEPLK